jgi:hypothetical protein
MSRRRLGCLLGRHHWSYGIVVAAPAVIRWCSFCRTSKISPALRLDQPPAPTFDTTFALLAEAFAGQPIEPADSRADTLTLIKATLLLTAMHALASPSAVLDIVQERLAAAEDVAAVRHLFDSHGRPR